MRLYLVRHAESVGNTKRLVTGTRDDPLTSRGLGQAARLGAMLQAYGIAPAAFFVSPWMRAQQTAAALLADQDWHVDERLGETHAGDVANWSLARFTAEHPEFWDDFSPSRPYPGGESHQDMYERATSWMREACTQADGEGDLLAVTHSGPITCMLQHVCGLGMQGFPAFLPMHASLSILDIEPDGMRIAAFSLFPPEVILS